eukprot:TRINITY_DN3210_c0_g1_i1.p1 TRINITY_DN3210_c0_g1~~TRINITY_DN3210_c0_g1_i1.p1  ORF type:complete len:553 (-),score=125.67 TRINITY_DN3210_c0_g1_i1:35-1618(-)
MKVLMMDEETTSIVSLVYSQLEILQEEVFLFERIDIEDREEMLYLRAICFLRPTDENIGYLKKELRRPHYGEYYIFFTNNCPDHYLEELASADEHEVVQEVQEFYADYFPVNTDTFTLNIRNCMDIRSDDWGMNLIRISDGLLSCCASLRIKPYIRYQRSSECAEMIASEIYTRIQQNSSLFHFSEGDSVLIIMDRKDDPLTPLLTQWTYQAMIHGLIGINNGIVELDHPSDDVPQSITLSRAQDQFYRENMYKDFGDLGIALKDLVTTYQRETNTNKNINSIEEMKSFINKYPKFKKLSGSVTKHVAIMDQLQKEISKRQLLDLSEFEQEMAVRQNMQQDTARLLGFLEQNINTEDAIRLIMMFALRYEIKGEQNVVEFIELLKEKGVRGSDLKMIRTLLRYAGSDKRSPDIDLFDNKDIFALARGAVNRGMKGVTNVYTQHQPLVNEIVDLTLNKKLSENSYPFYGGGVPRKPKEIVLFFVGGITYEEALHIHRLNSELPVSILIGGTTIHSPTTFLEDLRSFPQ